MWFMGYWVFYNRTSHFRVNMLFLSYWTSIVSSWDIRRCDEYISVKDVLPTSLYFQQFIWLHAFLFNQWHSQSHHKDSVLESHAAFFMISRDFSEPRDRTSIPGFRMWHTFLVAAVYLHAKCIKQSSFVVSRGKNCDFKIGAITVFINGSHGCSSVKTVPTGIEIPIIKIRWFRYQYDACDVIAPESVKQPGRICVNTSLGSTLNW